MAFFLYVCARRMVAKCGQLENKLVKVDDWGVRERQAPCVRSKPLKYPINCQAEGREDRLSSGGGSKRRDL